MAGNLVQQQHRLLGEGKVGRPDSRILKFNYPFIMDDVLLLLLLFVFSGG